MEEVNEKRWVNDDRLFQIYAWNDPILKVWISEKIWLVKSLFLNLKVNFLNKFMRVTQ